MKSLDEISNRLQERSRILTTPLSNVHRLVMFEEGEHLRAELQTWQEELRRQFLEAAGRRGWIQTAQSNLEVQ